MSFTKKILITGGAGFIGSHLVRHFVNSYPDMQIINLDLLTYAGNLNNLTDLLHAPNYVFVKADIVNLDHVIDVFETYQITDVIHLAAESHVDRSITDPTAFIKTNVLGTTNLLVQAKRSWKNDEIQHRFYHVSTDEVYGSLGDTGYFTESTPYDPRSPYSASKASSDHIVRAFYHTYHFPILISNCSNNYGPNQFPEKLIPLMIHNIRNNKSLPVYGQGTNVRDWLWVGDHVAAIDAIFQKGIIGETYNIGGQSEMQNIELVHMLCDLMDQKLNRPLHTSRDLISFVKDRPGHDQRYAIDSTKIQSQIHWAPTVQIKEGLEKTIDWYLSHEEWLNDVTSGEYLNYYETYYSK